MRASTLMDQAIAHVRFMAILERRIWSAQDFCISLEGQIMHLEETNEDRRYDADIEMLSGKLKRSWQEHDRLVELRYKKEELWSRELGT